MKTIDTITRLKRSARTKRYIFVMNFLLGLCWCNKDETGNTTISRNITTDKTTISRNTSLDNNTTVSKNASTTDDALSTITMYTTEPVPQTSSPVCDRIVCETEPGTYQINASLCQGWSHIFTLTLPPSAQRSAIGILTSPEEKPRSFLCVWRFKVPQGHVTAVRRYAPSLLSLLSLFTDKFSAKATRTRPGEEIGDSEIYLHQELNLRWFEQIFVFSFSGSVSDVRKFRVLLEGKTYAYSALPSGRLSQSVHFVTSPNFDGVSLYPNEYYGNYTVNVPHDHSVLIKFTHFHLEEPTFCKACPSKKHYIDELLIVEFHKDNNTAARTWRLSDSTVVPLQTFRRSIAIYFHSSKKGNFVGFRLLYVVIPTDQELVNNTGERYDCSLPFFKTAKYLFRCDLVVECYDSEDEEGCDIDNKVCGVGAVELGHKCLNFYFARTEMTWHEAQSFCLTKKQNLVTFSSPDYQQTFAWLKTEFNIFRFFLGLQLWKKSLVFPLSALYQSIWQWTDGRSAFVHVRPWHAGEVKVPLCAYFTRENMFSDCCNEKLSVNIICEFEKPVKTISVPDTFQNVSTEYFHSVCHNLSTTLCPRGYLTRDFLPCGEENHYFRGTENTVTCQARTEKVVMFPCDHDVKSVPYSLVCDRISHCKDNSDEDFCHFKPCPHHFFQCRSGQCIENNHVCDQILHCFDKSDEDSCNFPDFQEVHGVPLPTVFSLDGKGTYTVRHSLTCPSTHFRCPDGHCFPVFLRCNGIDDCPGREDEAECDRHACVGFYRCRQSTVCLHPDHVCDGVFQCPQYDDELLCQNRTCPDVCHCQGLAFVCSNNFSVTSYRDLRYLDVSGTVLMSETFTDSWHLIALRLSNTGMTQVPKLALPNLRLLDLSYNDITYCNMQMFLFLKNLRELILKGNPVYYISNVALSETDFKILQGLSFSYKIFRPLENLILKGIDVSHTHLRYYNGSAFAFAPELKVLNISWSRVHSITNEGFTYTNQLEVIDVRGSPLHTFPRDLLKSMASLQAVYANSFKLCCKVMLPDDFNINRCYAKEDALASCADLLRSNAYRVSLWIFMSMSVVGNAGSFVARLCLTSNGSGMGSFGVFVTHLCMADFFMGIYLAIIGIADLIYQGEYLWHDDQWKTSSVCSMAGFLSLMSNEVSAFIICLITFDRFIVLRFPFSRFRFKKQSSLVTGIMIWIVGIALAGFPLLPVVSHWKFYSQTSICIPLPFATGERFEGRSYSMGIMIIVNFVLFVLIALGQFLIYWSVHKNSMSSSKNQGSKDLVIARRLTTVVISDFLCWFPVGLLGLLSSTGTSVPTEVNVGVAIFVMPFNSAVNPFLYTFNVLMEKRQKQREDRLLKRLQASSTTANSHSTTKN